VVVTIDDGPVVNELTDLGNFQRVSSALVNALISEKVPATILINERQLNADGQRDGRAAVLSQWLDAGYDLGNHTYSHPSLNKIPLAEFEDNIIKGEVIMRPLIEAHGRKLVWFRFPFLDSGATAEVHQAVLDFLAVRHYRVAPVTVDYKDYIFAGAYSRRLRAGDREAADKIKEAYLEYVDTGFESAERISRRLLGYELAQILLIHCSELNSVTLRDSIARIRKRGYSFITLESARKDPAYQRPDNFTGPGGAWLEHLGEAMGKPVTEDLESGVPQWIRERPRQQ
jgi:peptidoglycan/xylan/chitin deacetylase (PgdA/CDA1 family)